MQSRPMSSHNINTKHNIYTTCFQNPFSTSQFNHHQQPHLTYQSPHSQLHKTKLQPYKSLCPKPFSKPPNSLHKSTSPHFNPEKQLHFKPDSQFFGTSNAKTYKTKLIGHETSFPKHQASSTNSQNRKSYAQNTNTAVLKNRFKHLF